MAIAEIKFLVLHFTISFLGNRVHTKITYKKGSKASRGTCSVVQLSNMNQLSTDMLSLRWHCLIMSCLVTSHIVLPYLGLHDPYLPTWSAQVSSLGLWKMDVRERIPALSTISYDILYTTNLASYFILPFLDRGGGVHS